MNSKEVENIFNAFFENINRCLKPNGLFLNSLILMNPEYPNWIITDDNDKKNKINMVDMIHCYNLSSLYGCGRYPTATEYIKYAKNCFDIKLIRNVTEDYRWSGIQNGETNWQYHNIYINTPYRVMKLISYLLTDMWIFGRINYSIMRTFLWQFGGEQQTPIYNNDKSPMICNLHILQKLEKCKTTTDNKVLKVY